MVRGIPEYTMFAKRLLKDRAIYAPDKRTVLCYRVADEREQEASQMIMELVDALEKSIADLREFCVCGTCAAFQKNPKDKKSCHRNKSTPYVSITTSGCHKWTWRGGVIEED